MSGYPHLWSRGEGRIENQIKDINDLIADIMKHQGIHSPPWKSRAVKEKQSFNLIEEGKSQVATEVIANRNLGQEKPAAHQQFLKKYDNSS